ncbi:MAG TPA: TlpA disulfide reductase family protein [Anaerolineaceae bacterium]|nr:TlpA disulfide reductase family protein [Anaerolineaceae bacterium]
MRFRLVGFGLIGLGIGVLLSAIVFWTSSLGLFQGQPTTPGQADTPLIGARAPEFTLLTLNGEQVQLAHFRGKPVMLNFWATWCNPCKEEMPLIQAAASRPGNNLIVLGINDDESADLVREFIQEYKISFRVLMDPGAKVTDLYQIRGFPTSYFLDPGGKIQAVHIGSISADQLEGYLRRIGATN